MRRHARTALPCGIACFPPTLTTNPYQRLLYEHLRERGLEVADDARFKLRWLVQARRRVGVLHFHWPKNYYSHFRRPAVLRRPLSWVKLPLFALRLLAARALGYRIVWTVHEVFPHERGGRLLDRLGAKALARLSDVRIAHDRATAERARSELGTAAGHVDVIEHGSYIGVYPPGRPRAEVRRELGIAGDAFVFLSFGHLRPYKETDVLLEAFAGLRRPDAVLVVAGLVMDERAATLIASAAAVDPRIRPLLGFVPDESVGELFGASDAVAVTRGDGGTSGALVLAFSLGTPAVAAATAAYQELIGADQSAGWLFRPGDADSLRAAFEAAAADPARARAKGAAAYERIERARWPEIAEATATLMRGSGANHVARELRRAVAEQ